MFYFSSALFQMTSLNTVPIRLCDQCPRWLLTGILYRLQMFPKAIELALAGRLQGGLNCASLSFLRSWTDSTGPNSASSADRAVGGKITGVSAYSQSSHSLTVFVPHPQFSRTNPGPSGGTRFPIFPGLICSNIFGGSLPITGNGGVTGVQGESGPILSILPESIAQMPT
jgi:hypothetical protein